MSIFSSSHLSIFNGWPVHRNHFEVVDLSFYSGKTAQITLTIFNFSLTIFFYNRFNSPLINTEHRYRFP